MGCTLNYTTEDHRQAMQSLKKQPGSINISDTSRRAEIRTALSKTSSQRLVEILSNPNHPAYAPLSNHLALSVGTEMTPAEERHLPEAFKVVLEQNSNAMGVFEKPPAHRGPGSSPIQHHYEVFAAAALMVKPAKTVSGTTLRIDRADRVDFGIKFARGYAQPARHGTIEADILVSKGPLGEQRTVGIDAKFSKTGNYGVKSTEEFERQLDGIRTGFRDGKIDGFSFVTNGRFSPGFQDLIKRENLKIARNFAKKHNRLFPDADKQYLSRPERESIPEGKTPAGFFREDNPKVIEFVSKYKIPQIDMCHYVKFPGT